MAFSENNMYFKYLNESWREGKQEKHVEFWWETRLGNESDGDRKIGFKIKRGWK